MTTCLCASSYLLQIVTSLNGLTDALILEYKSLQVYLIPWMFSSILEVFFSQKWCELLISSCEAGRNSNQVLMGRPMKCMPLLYQWACNAMLIATVLPEFLS